MAAAHFTVMRLLTTSENDKLQAGEVVKLTNAAARMMEVYQNASLTLQKLKTRGTQRIEVRYPGQCWRRWSGACGWQGWGSRSAGPDTAKVPLTPMYAIQQAPRCGAKTRQQTACRNPAMKNGRCRMHGGLSTGPRPPEGLERSRLARWKHGAYSQETKAMLRESRRQWRELLALLST